MTLVVDLLSWEPIHPGVNAKGSTGGYGGYDQMPSPQSKATAGPTACLGKRGAELGGGGYYSSETLVSDNRWNVK